MQYLLAFLLITGLAHGQGSIKDEFKGPELSPIMREMPILRSIPPSDPKLIKRLVRVDDNFQTALDPFWDNPDKGLRIPEVFWENYTELYQDKKDSSYYVALFRKPSPNETKGIKINWGRPKPKTSKKRLVVISNLSPSLSLVADAADQGTPYIRQIVPTYDFYKGYLSARGYLYSDPSNQNPVKLTPITNKKTGGIAYKGVSPNSGRPFYMDRSLHRYRDFSHDVSSTGGFIGMPADTLEEIWERQKPDDPVWDI